MGVTGERSGWDVRGGWTGWWDFRIVGGACVCGGGVRLWCVVVGGWMDGQDSQDGRISGLLVGVVAGWVNAETRMRGCNAMKWSEWWEPWSEMRSSISVVPEWRGIGGVRPEPPKGGTTIHALGLLRLGAMIRDCGCVLT